MTYHAPCPLSRAGLSSIAIALTVRTLTAEPVILDFNCAKVLDASLGDKQLAAKELERITDMLDRAMGRRLAVDHLSKTFPLKTPEWTAWSANTPVRSSLRIRLIDPISQGIRFAAGARVMWTKRRGVEQLGSSLGS